MLHVVSIGRIVQDPACYSLFTGKPVVYPDHYTVHRAIFSSPVSITKPTFLYKATSAGAAAVAAQAMPTPFFVATISVVPASDTAGASLRFHLTRSDRPAERVYTGTTSATTVWREALEDALRDFPDERAQLLVPSDSKGHLQVNGIRLFGLHLKEVQEELMALPGGAEAFEAAAAALHAAGGHVSPQASQPSPSTTKAAERRNSSTSPSGGAPGARPASRKRSSRAASAEKDAALSNSNNITVTSVMDDATSNSNSQPPSVVAVTPVKPKRPRKPRADGAATFQMPSTGLQEAVGGVEGSGSGAIPPPPPPSKRRRSSVKRNTNSSGQAESAAPASSTFAAASTAVAPAAMAACPDCGLTGTPFCAATGMPHELPPCPACGLRTAFCPVSGQPHAAATPRENRQRGEVHLPGSSRKPRRRAAAAKMGQQLPPQASGDTVEMIVVNTQDGSENPFVTEHSAAAGDAAKKSRRKRVRTASTAEDAVNGDAVDAPTEVATADGSAPARPRRGRGTKSEGAATSAAKKAAAVSANGDAVAAAPPPLSLEGDQPLYELAKRSVYIYPPLRPPLSTRAHHRAAQLLQETWKAQYDDGPVLPPAVAAVPLTFVPAKRPVGAAEAGGGGGAPRARRRGRGAAAAAVKGEENANRDAVKDAAEQEQLGEETEGESSATARSGTAGLPTSPSVPAALSTMVHPLEVTQLSTSVAGKRLTRFLLQYASERSQFDLLRSRAAVTTAAGGSAERRFIKGRSPANGEGIEEGGDAVEKADTHEEGAELKTAATEHTDMVKSEPDEEMGVPAV
ncbi:hypothetical protein ABL78_7320 [Leptomonas seymouri]|uniref:Uncharacterized protein n=1 Tax=Leptomonas seymouri TaxID=5684 RepID=A0A0N1PAK0_LEPSE|nr:hypothetical protein ABL78_7320 [Leptomonas seymouri]|eukprot:KPI83648.1 hypothetical protein ABL78_7320 [Leptomonas seymouri]